MDHRELEEKLEKDNITLKEHIIKLQNTIKNIKGEINNEPIRGKVYNPTREEKAFKTIKSHNNSDIKEYIPDDEHLKFSFNTKPSCDTNEVRKEDKGNNFYQENLKKIRKEKETINKMEQVKKEANIKKKFTDEDQDDIEISRFQKNFKNKKLNESDEEHKENIPVFNNNYFKNKSTINSFKRNDDYDFNDTKDLRLEDLSRANIYDRKEYIDYNNIFTNKHSSPITTKPDYDTNESFIRNTMKVKTINKDKSDNSDSFENKVKIVQNTKKTNHNKINSANINIKRDYTLPKNKEIVHKSNTKKIIKKSDDKQNCNDKMMMKNEIKVLKKQVTKLTNENSRLKEQLQNEKSQNMKFKELTEEIIKFYEQSAKKKTK